MLESLSNNNAGLQACNFIKKRLQQRCFPVNIAKFLRTPILKNICERLLLESSRSNSKTQNLLFFIENNQIDLQQQKIMEQGILKKYIHNIHKSRKWKTSCAVKRWQRSPSWQRSLSYRNKSIDLLSNSMNWFLYDRDLRHKS